MGKVKSDNRKVKWNKQKISFDENYERMTRKGFRPVSQFASTNCYQSLKPFSFEGKRKL